MSEYKVIKEGATLPKKVGDRFSAKNRKKAVELNTHIVYSYGDIVEEENLAPSIIEKYEKGDEVILTLIEKISEKSE